MVSNLYALSVNKIITYWMIFRIDMLPVTFEVRSKFKWNSKNMLIAC